MLKEFFKDLGAGLMILGFLGVICGLTLLGATHPMIFGIIFMIGFAWLIGFIFRNL